MGVILLYSGALAPVFFGDRAMLYNNMKSQLKVYLEKLIQPVELIATLDESEKSSEINALLQDISTLSDKITFNKDNKLAVRKPSFLITNPGKDSGLRFAIGP